MANVSRTGVVVCTDTCGCPAPCPGGDVCRCVVVETGASGDPNMEHKRCTCGEHCGCNPCTCSKTEIAGTGKAFCKCGPGCTCVTCTA
ncbi:metallothionein-like protein 4B [Malania oleifera]|uniref:metallothionein-like protein 4B n=1 Tax=Malania oleifera TaxID=397392 RepID=UPI0025ADA1D3|nr:metallothionein-like protein 4B [Malania oleifera]